MFSDLITFFLLLHIKCLLFNDFSGKSNFLESKYVCIEFLVLTNFEFHLGGYIVVQINIFFISKLLHDQLL